MFSDGNAEKGNGNIFDTYVLDQTVKVLRDDYDITIVGALILNSDDTQRIEELKGIVTEPEDAIDVEFSDANLNDIADRLAARVKRVVCRGKIFALIHEKLLDCLSSSIFCQRV